MNYKLFVLAILPAIVLCTVSYDPAYAGDYCIKITRAQFEQVYYGRSLGIHTYDPDETAELALVITGENMYGWGRLRVFIDGEELKQRWNEKWRYGLRSRSNMAGSPFVTYETDHNKIWVRGLIPNQNPRDHVIAMIRSGKCKSNEFHAAW